MYLDKCVGFRLLSNANLLTGSFLLYFSIFLGFHVVHILGNEVVDGQLWRILRCASLVHLCFLTFS